ncbi:MAG: ABC transporter ATP-binding protein [Gammaproteobacteria bacterium]|nr:ABC transporter ATP-binding protein [Gammaproteobacteria bacterium]
MNAPILSIQGLTHRYAGTPALEGIAFALRSGEVVGLLGENGAGKSSLLRLVAGLLPVQAGRLRFAGQDQRRGELAYLADPPALHDDVRVADFLALSARLMGLSPSAARRGVARELERLDLGELRGRLIGPLSKGQRQRVGLAAALLAEPALLLLDEPSSGLDPVQQARFRALVRELGRERAVLLSSHQLEEVQACADRALILHEGRLRADLDLSCLRQPSLILRLRDAPAFELLRELPGVVDAAGLDGERILLSLERRDESIAPAIAREVVLRGWGLLELTPGGSLLASRFFAILQEGRA